MIPKTADSTNISFGRPLGLSMRGKKIGRVNDLSLVGFPWQLIYVRTNFAKKRLKMTKSSNAAKALKLLGIIRRFMYFLQN